MKNMRRAIWALVAMFSMLLLVQVQTAAALTANKVWMELRANGRYRVYVNYTIPELKEFREAYMEFAKKVEAEKVYFDLIRGADLYPPKTSQREFKNPPTGWAPW